MTQSAFSSSANRANQQPSPGLAPTHVPRLGILPSPEPEYNRRAKRRRNRTRQRQRVETALAGLPIHEQIAAAKRLLIFARGTGWHPSKIASGLLLIAVVTSFALLHSQDMWFVYTEDVQFQNVAYLDSQQLYAMSNVESMNIFWIRPEDIRQELLKNPWIADAEVTLGVPAQVVIDITEQQPVAVWETNQGVFWLSPEGYTLPYQDYHGDALPRIVDSLAEAHAITNAVDPILEQPMIDQAVLQSALSLMATMPELRGQVRYNRGVGLNFQLPEVGVWVYWGDGQYSAEKLTNLAAIQKVLLETDATAQIINVRSVDQPYFR